MNYELIKHLSPYKSVENYATTIEEKQFIKSLPTIYKNGKKDHKDWLKRYNEEHKVYYGHYFGKEK